MGQFPKVFLVGAEKSTTHGRVDHQGGVRQQQIGEHDFGEHN